MTNHEQLIKTRNAAEIALNKALDWRDGPEPNIGSAVREFEAACAALAAFEQTK